MVRRAIETRKTHDDHRHASEDHEHRPQDEVEPDMNAQMQRGDDRGQHTNGQGDSIGGGRQERRGGMYGAQEYRRKETQQERVPSRKTVAQSTRLAYEELRRLERAD